jgi:HEAT repeat protein
VGKRRFFSLAGLIAVVLIGTAWLVFRSPSEPAYGGKPLSFWLEQYCANPARFPDFQPNAENQEAERAIRQIGTNALPQLLRMVSSPMDAGLRLRLVSFLREHSVRTSFSLEYGKEWLGVGGFRALGREARPAIPLLVKMLPNEHVSRGSTHRELIVFQALLYIGADSIPALRPLLTSPHRGVRLHAVESLIALSPGKEIDGDLVKLLKDEDPAVRNSASDFFLMQPTESALPWILDNLRHTNSGVRATAANTLGYYGKLAEPALPELHRAKLDGNPDVRRIATEAIRRINIAIAATNQNQIVNPP